MEDREHIGPRSANFGICQEGEASSGRHSRSHDTRVQSKIHSLANGGICTVSAHRKEAAEKNAKFRWASAQADLGRQAGVGGGKQRTPSKNAKLLFFLHASVGTSAGTGPSLPRCRRESWRESTILSLSTITAGDSGAVVPE